MSLKKHSSQTIRNIIILFILVCTATLIISSYQLFSAFHELEHHTKNSYESQILAEELQESSDELTRLARTFVATGNHRFEKQFYEVLDIRNGKKPRPKKYNSLYWDFIATQDHIPIGEGEKKALIEYFKDLGIEGEELQLILKSNQLSNDLIKLEETAFRAIKNSLLAEDEEYRSPGESNKDMAIRLLNDDRYHDLKIDIMTPVQNFIAALWLRTDKQKSKLTDKIQQLKLLMSLMVALILIALSLYIFQQKRNNETISSKIEKTKKENLVLTKISETDTLTQLANRRSLDNKLRKEWSNAKQPNLPLSIILIDIDYFKEYNDIAGHQAGDLCLQKVGALLSTCAHRTGELVARYGGEEFMIVLPNTSIDAASQVAENTRELIMSAKLHNKGTREITISAGVACQTPNDNDSLEELIANADKALYSAKENGRNRVEVA